MATTNRPRLSEKGLLTPDNCVVAMIDLQPQMLFGTCNFDRQTIINNNTILAKAARVFDVPTVLTTVESKGFSGNTWPPILAALGHPTPIERTSMNSWGDKKFVAEVERIGRKKLVIAALWTEVCLAFPAIQAMQAPNLVGEHPRPAHQPHEASESQVDHAAGKP